MKAWSEHRGCVLPLLRNDIDTDQILPKQFMKKTDKIGFGKLLFFNWRYLDENGTKENPDFIMNQKEWSEASILIAGENFGCGSSREHAPWALVDYGFRVILAESFADIFYGNAAKNGLALIKLPKQILESIADKVNINPNMTLHVDLSKMLIFHGEEEYSFSMPNEISERITNGLDDIGMTLKHWDKILAFEKQMSLN